MCHNDYEIAREEVKEQLDVLIKHWRDVRDKKIRTERVDLTEEHNGYCPADCYVDAYQSVRMNIFKELLP